MTKMMVVDDSRVIRNKILRMAASGGINDIVQAGNGREACEVFHRERPQLVTMDITMPEMDGVECVSKLVEMDDSVKILVISALADKATAIQALQNGAHGFLCKPFDDAQLNSAIDELMNG